jgi:transketolase
MAFLREGDDVTLLASGPIVSLCLEAAEQLAALAIQAAVVSVPCLKPLDEPSIMHLAQGGVPIVTVEEHVMRGGLYAGIASLLVAHPKRPVVSGLGIPEPFKKISRGGNREELLSESGLSAASIISRVRAIVGR